MRTADGRSRRKPDIAGRAVYVAIGREAALQSSLRKLQESAPKRSFRHHALRSRARLVVARGKGADALQKTGEGSNSVDSSRLDELRARYVVGRYRRGRGELKLPPFPPKKCETAAANAVPGLALPRLRPRCSESNELRAIERRRLGLPLLENGVPGSQARHGNGLSLALGPRARSSTFPRASASFGRPSGLSASPRKS